jgi:hypothetical protein
LASNLDIRFDGAARLRVPEFQVIFQIFGIKDANDGYAIFSRMKYSLLTWTRVTTWPRFTRALVRGRW